MSEQQIIIFEGADKTGKTSIATTLSDELKIPYFHNPKEQKYFAQGDFDLALRFNGVFLLDFLEVTRYNIILDRNYPSEYAYSKAYNRKLSFATLLNIDEGYSKLRTKIIYCFKETYNEDSLIDFDHWKRVKVFYEIFFRKITSCSNLWVNTGDQNLRNQLVEIKEFLI